MRLPGEALERLQRLSRDAWTPCIAREALLPLADVDVVAAREGRELRPCLDTADRLRHNRKQ